MISDKQLWCAAYAGSLLTVGLNPNPIATVIGVFCAAVLLLKIPGHSPRRG